VEFEPTTMIFDFRATVRSRLSPVLLSPSDLRFAQGGHRTLIPRRSMVTPNSPIAASMDIERPKEIPQCYEAVTSR
jgi:hypothetical protein